MNSPDPTNEPLSVTSALDQLRILIDSSIGTHTLVGTIHGITTAHRWRRGELVSEQSGSIVARVPLVIPPIVALPCPADELEGAEAAVIGRFDIHPQYGPLQFIASLVTVQAARSAAAISTQETVERLHRSGAIHAHRALRLPARPNRVGLIAPLGGGAGGTDFLDRLRAATELVHINSRYVPMGGPDSIASIVEAIQELSVTDSELIFICRGGGARSGLTMFDSPEVLAAICTAPLPIVVAVGHATDQTAADLVCHTSLPTPSAAATWLIDRRRHEERAQLVARAANRSHEAAAAQRHAEIRVEAATLAEHRAERTHSIAVGAVAAMVALIVVLAGAHSGPGMTATGGHRSMAMEGPSRREVSSFSSDCNVAR